MGSGEAYQRQKARSTVHHLVRAIMGIGYDEQSAVEIAGCVIEDAGRDGVNTEHLLEVLEKIDPLPRKS